MQDNSINRLPNPKFYSQPYLAAKPTSTANPPPAPVKNRKTFNLINEPLSCAKKIDMNVISNHRSNFNVLRSLDLRLREQFNNLILQRSQKYCFNFIAGQPILESSDPGYFDQNYRYELITEKNMRNKTNQESRPNLHEWLIFSKNELNNKCGTFQSTPNIVASSTPKVIKFF